MEVWPCLPGLYFSGFVASNALLLSLLSPPDKANLNLGGACRRQNWSCSSTRGERLQPHSLQLQPHAGKHKHQRAKMPRFKEKTLVQVVDESKHHNRKVPFHSSKPCVVPRTQQTSHSIPERKAEKQQYNDQSSDTQLEHYVEKAVLRLSQSPGHRENDAIGLTFEAEPERLVSITEQRPLGDRPRHRIPYLSATGQRCIFSKQAEQKIGL